MTAPCSRPCVIAHRGASAARPENTLSAFDAALAEGCDGMELDLQLTADGVVVVYHDDDLGKLGQPQRRMADIGLADLARLDAAAWRAGFAPEPVPGLAEVLERYAARTELCLELKPLPGDSPARNAALVRRTLEKVYAAGAAERVWILCFDPNLLRDAHREAPELRYVLNALNPAQAEQGLVAMPWLKAVDVDIEQLQPEDGARLRRPHSALMSYTCDSEAQLRRAAAAGVQYVITNRPAASRALLNTFA